MDNQVTAWPLVCAIPKNDVVASLTKSLAELRQTLAGEAGEFPTVGMGPADAYCVTIPVASDDDDPVNSRWSGAERLCSALSDESGRTFFAVSKVTTALNVGMAFLQYEALTQSG